MEWLFSFIALIFSIYLFAKYENLKGKQNEFLNYIQRLEKRIKWLEINKDIPSRKEEVTSEKSKIIEPEKDSKEPTPIQDIIPKLPFIVEEEIPESKPVVPPVIKKDTAIPKTYINAANTPLATHQREQTKVKSPIVIKKNEIWAKIEKQFVENWTGILGSVIMVVGVGFLGVYAALKISAIGRFILITSFSGLLGALFFYLHKKPDWLKLALWIRSSAGAIFLFACAASIAVPGLKWVDNEIMGLIILLLGVVVNLFLGYIGNNQGFASLHVLLSLIAVWVIPPSPTLLIVGAAITLFGIALTYREKWDYHLLFTVSCFFVFHLLYWFSLNHIVSVNNRIIGIITILTICFAVALVHYRKAYSTKIFEKTPFIVHLLNWFYFGMGLYLYSSGSRMATFFIAGGAIVAFLLARRGKKLEIRWLYHTDTLIAQFTAIIALVSLFRWELDQSIIIAAVFAEGLLFLFIAQKENDTLLYKIGSVTLNISGVILLIYGLVTIDYTNYGLLFKQAGAMMSSAVLGSLFLLYSNKTATIDTSGLYSIFNIRLNDKTKHPLLGVVVGALFLNFFIHVYEYQWSIYSVVIILLVILFLRNKLQAVELAFTSAIFLVGAHIINWYQLYHIQSQGVLQLLIVGLPVLSASALSIKYSFVKRVSKHLNWIGVYLFSIQLILLSYYLLAPISELAVSCVWLLLSLLALIIVKLISKKSLNYHQVERYILHAGYVLISLFIIRHLTVDLFSEELWATVKGRIVVEIFAFVVFVLWAITKRGELPVYKTWKYLHPLFIELIVLFSFFTISHEITYRYFPLTCLLMAGIALILASWKGQAIARINVYSFCIFITSMVYEVKIYMDAIDAPSLNIEGFTLAFIFIISSFTYLLFYYKRAELSAINWPHLLRFMHPIGEGLNNSAAFIGVYSFGAFLLLITYFMFTSISSIIPGVIWLLLSAFVSTFSIFCYGEKSNFINVDRYMLHLTYLFLAAFLVRHVLVHIQLESYVGVVRTRLLIEVLALSVFMYCATLKNPGASTYKSWDYLHPLLTELIILFSVFTITLEVDAIWQPLIWVAMAFLFALLGNLKYEKKSRLLFYSLVMYWVAAFQTSFVTSSYVVPSEEMYAQPWVYGTMSILLQFIFLLYFYLKCNFEKIVLPKSLLFLTEFIGKIQKRRNSYVFYPLIICTAVYLFWTFDKSVLTLLWVIECLLIFVISIILKEQHFRYIALGALAICIVRLILFDLSQASTLNRAIVFLGVGIIMLVMNSLYNKFKSRFE